MDDAMDETTINQLRNNYFTIVPAEYRTLYSGTNDLKFAVSMVQGHGWQSQPAFQAAYCGQTLGGTAVYGPGIYMTDKLQEAKSYGEHILVFSFKPAADYLDLANPSVSKGAVKLVGGGKQTILSEPKLDALIRVTRDYFVLRTPMLASVHLQ
jgi:hypothetical protein